MRGEYEVDYGSLHPFFYANVIFTTIVLLSMLKPPAFYKKLLMKIMHMKVNLIGSEFRVYSLLILWVFFLTGTIVCNIF